ncbi:relaxase/mobilization nuclease domain-containing protein [Rhizobium sp. CG4]|uniref:relaxase/mobilization nuclease domain-containing protein n=1 Tax=Rhizobium sp. CG4 TaxID=2726075 RepID=UPI0020342B34|nr:relaxase/mobilization nuclease domain-containing protein [Rhizobium sp. CG4]MCM2458850.1 relaxase/mobilization nuclease domain-containing protein [Rhizobium sp. CG4]
MSSRLATFAEEIERYLGVKRDPESEREENRAAAARERGGVAQARSRDPESVAGKFGPKIVQRRRVSSAQSAVVQNSSNAKCGVSGFGRAHQTGSGAGPSLTMTGFSTSAVPSAQLAISVFNAVFAAEEKDDDSLMRARGGSRRSSDVLGSAGSFALPGQVAARAAYSAGAQEAVFKVISSTPTKVRAAALLAYVGTREGEDGKKQDIAVYTDEGHVLNDAQDRKDFLGGFAESFEPALQNTNFIEVKFVMQDPVKDDELRDALNQVFGSKPFVYARSGQTVKTYALTDKKAATISKVLSEGRENSRSKIVEKIEAGFQDSLSRSNIAASAEIVGAVGNERQAVYFLQKFIRTNRNVKSANGDPAKGAGNPQRAATKLFDSWKKDMAGNERRNAFHLLFSAKAGTDPQAVMQAARAVLEDKAHGHKYAFAHHGDTQHVHVHVMVQAVSDIGERLNFKKADLYEWREAFAEKARENGIAMVATRRQEHAKPRPYTKEHAGALKRAQQDTGYSVSSATENRVLDKRSGMIDPETARRDGSSIAAAWRQTARVMEDAGVEPRFVANADRFADNVVRFVSKENRPQTETSLEDLDMAPAAKLLEEMETAGTPRAMAQIINMINETLDTLYATLRVSDRVRFNELRAELYEVLNARHAKLEQELHYPSGGSNNSDDGNPDNVGARELSAAQQSGNEKPTVDAAVKKNDEKKLEVKKHSETIKARRQRERDNDKGR